MAPESEAWDEPAARFPGCRRTSGRGRSTGGRDGLAGRQRPYTPPRTPWGDPDLQGTYTNKYEQSTPLERPAQFAGRRVEDVAGAELADVLENETRR